MARHRFSWLFIIWVVIGLIIAWTHAYITVAILKVALTAALGVFLWPLLLLGVSLHLS
jgi:predicted lysophospholipase L1 biosynthesis ABC-type transport system permease subunit